MTSLHDQIMSGALVPDYTHDQFITYAPPPPPPAPTPKWGRVTLPPAPTAIAIDQLLADTLERTLSPVKVTSLIDHATRAVILFALRRSGGNQVRAAAMLGINRMTLRKRCARHSVDPLMFGSCHGQPEAK